MMLLQLQDISKSYGLHTILNGASLTLNTGGRIGIVGPNGAGKSTLLKIITGEVDADTGTLEVAPALRLGYLPQRFDLHHNVQTVADILAEALAELHTLESQMRDLEAKMSTSDGDALNAIMTAYGEAADAFERGGGYEMQARSATVLVGLQIDHLGHERRVDTLSGGERSRLGLAALLLRAPDILLLDEPTNHLDFHTMAWLEAHLTAYRGAMLVVSHDRAFLNNTVNIIVEIDEHTRTTRHYTGNYDAYLQTKTHERARWQVAYAEQQEAIKQLQYEIKVGAHSNRNYRTHTDGDKFVRNFKIARHDQTVAKRIHAAEERLKRIQDNPLPKPPEPLLFDADFTADDFGARFPLEAIDLHKSYDQRPVLDAISFTLPADGRVVLVGPNGAGKSTLMRLIMRLEAPDSGVLRLNPSVKVGYLDQDQRTLDPTQNVFAACINGLEADIQAEKRLRSRLIAMGLFRNDDLEKQVGHLSTGQQRKVQIARLLLGEATLLILDEPTNDVSFDVIEGLETALQAFPGPIIAASHDRRFIAHFAGEVWHLQQGRLTCHLHAADVLLQA